MEIILGVRKGAWSKQEDDLLRACIQRYGEGKWHLVPQRAGLNRCRKSCRLRWMNYLKPDIKRGNFTEDEADMIMRFHRLLGNRWSLIAGRLPGRTSNDVKNYWNTHMRKKLQHHSSQNDEKQEATMKTHQVIRPQPLTFSRKSSWLRRKPVGAIINNNGDDSSNRGKPIIAINNNNNNNCSRSSDKAPGAASAGGSEKSREWWESLLDDVKEGDEEDSLWCLGGEKQEKLLTYLWDEQLYFLNDPETQ